MKKLILIFCTLLSISTFAQTAQHCIKQYGTQFCFIQVGSDFYTNEEDLPMLEMNRDIKELGIEFIVLDRNSYNAFPYDGIIYYGYGPEKGVGHCMMEAMEGFGEGFGDGAGTGATVGATVGGVVGAIAGGVSTAGAGTLAGLQTGAAVGAVAGGAIGGTVEGVQQGAGKFNDCMEDDKNIQDKPGR